MQEPIAFHRRKNLEIFLLVASIATLIIPIRGWSGLLPLNIGLSEGTVITTQRFNARTLILDITSGNVTLRSGKSAAIIVETTRYGYGITSAAGRVVAERLALPAITADVDTLHISDTNTPGVNLSIFGRVPFRNYTITLPEDAKVEMHEQAGMLDLR